MGTFYYSWENICFCNDILFLISELEIPFDIKEWCPVIDGSKTSLMTVLYLNGKRNKHLKILNEYCT